MCPFIAYPCDRCDKQIANEESQRDQLLRYLKNSSYIEQQYKSSTHNQFKVYFTVTLHWAIIRLKDNCRLDIHHIGGATFAVVSISNRHHFECLNIDYANGVYEIICALRGRCHNITVTITYHDYSANRRDGVWINQTIW